MSKTVQSAAKIPPAGRWAVEASVPACLVPQRLAGIDQDGLARICLTVADGRIEAIEAVTGPSDALSTGMVFPSFVELHTHLDKGHIWPRRRNPDGTFFGALDNVTLDREANWSAADVAARMEFSLRCAYAHGTCAIRTHLDSIGKQIGISWPVFSQVREKWAGRIDLQAVALFSIEHVSDRAHVSTVTAAV